MAKKCNEAALSLLGLHGEDRLRRVSKKVGGGVHEGPDRVGPVPRGAERVLQLQARSIGHEEEDTRGEAVLNTPERVLGNGDAGGAFDVWSVTKTHGKQQTGKCCDRDIGITLKSGLAFGTGW
eukprot:CAMPEP_0172551770 /NCGR_PEP_ID=MMETSP1067-20121228/40842_1 /TAXON_ID=265564 ORGANISM="Thalassiosira punctigera, Strain Tpunct2005C2" /NCGR_SAMPLE_ID=MMETSP1067 /ASSEMBLY_ACC=CAM_ASM_000444 /LENGTH=122 /DNA_ID=CAMNT_0013339601 /DNA_START=110 /DNA_END=475 /DNA_ORIENTATION=+